MHKKIIGWDISEMMNNDMEIFLIDISIVGITFEDYLQNLFTVLKQCMEINLMLI